MIIVTPCEALLFLSHSCWSPPSSNKFLSAFSFLWPIEFPQGCLHKHVWGVIYRNMAISQVAMLQPLTVCKSSREVSKRLFLLLWTVSSYRIITILLHPRTEELFKQVFISCVSPGLWSLRTSCTMFNFFIWVGSCARPNPSERGLFNSIRQCLFF